MTTASAEPAASRRLLTWLPGLVGIALGLLANPVGALWVSSSAVRLTAPGRVDLPEAEPGRYTVFLEWDPAGPDAEDPKAGLVDMAVVARRVDGVMMEGTQVPPQALSYRWWGLSAESTVDFTVRERGHYQVEAVQVRTPPPGVGPATLAVVFQARERILATLAAAAFCVSVGVAWSAALWLRRRRRPGRA